MDGKWSVLGSFRKSSSAAACGSGRRVRVDPSELNVGDEDAPEPGVVRAVLGTRGRHGRTPVSEMSERSTLVGAHPNIVDLKGSFMKYSLGIDVACRAVHVATLADAAGQMVWSNHRFRTSSRDLNSLWERIPAGAQVTVVLEPTRNAWVPLVSWLRAKGAVIVLVPPEQSADLRRYYDKHTKNDRLDSVILSRLPLLHPDGLILCEDSGPAAPLKRAVRRRSQLLDRRTKMLNRLTAMIELLGPGYLDVLGARLHTHTAMAVLERYADPRRLLRTPASRLTKAGDPGLRTALFMAADLARQVDPTLAAKYRRLVVEKGKHHNSAMCHLATILATRIAACLRTGQRYQLRDLDGRDIDEAEGRRICAEKHPVKPEERPRRTKTKTGQMTKGVA